MEASEVPLLPSEMVLEIGSHHFLPSSPRPRSSPLLR